MPCNQYFFGQSLPPSAMEASKFQLGLQQKRREEKRSKRATPSELPSILEPPHGLQSGSNGLRLLTEEEARFDPYQVFEVEHRPCLLLHVKVLRGRNVTKGWAADLLDTPDPYVELRIRSAPNGKRRTVTIDNEPNPVWDETFVFLLDQSLKNILQISLMEDNYVMDSTIGCCYFDVKDLVMNKWTNKTFMFNEVSEVDLKFMIELDPKPTLRYSLCLCQEEKDFLSVRKTHAMKAMRQLLGFEGPRNITETLCIREYERKKEGETATDMSVKNRPINIEQLLDEPKERPIAKSHFRPKSKVPTVAVIGSGGGFRAMVGMSGVIKALSDTGVLDCSTYVAGLSGSSWFLSTLYSHPKWPNVSPEEVQNELKQNIDSSLLWLLKPQSVCRYVDRIMEKRRQGQPVSFTDFFGHLVGETLLKDRLDSKLTDQQNKIQDGDVPMPLYTCVHVKKDVSARSFQEWVEFTPFEIGMPKYGTYMKTNLFGSKFFMGKLCKQFEEPPLHFLQGIWGSAFCILFNRLLEDNRKLDPVEMIRQEMEKQLENGTDDNDASNDDSDSEDTDENVNSDDEDDVSTKPPPAKRGRYEAAKRPPLKRQKSKTTSKGEGFWSGLIKGLVENKRYELLSTRAGRAGVVHNFMRGLSLQETYPLSPFSPAKPFRGQSDEFDGIFEMYPTNIKRLYMVDAGLTFNSPYPLVLRPQRGVDVILSFDFSARPSDMTQPFKELQLAEKWARINRLPFPHIDTSVFEKEGMKELYIFRDPNDPHCPIILHFVLVNLDFRKYKKPGVLRKTAKDKAFADFSLFDDASTPYSTFNFKYSHEAFDRLAQLMEFNTLKHLSDIKDAIAHGVQKRRNLPLRVPIPSTKVKLLRIKSVDNRRKLTNYLKKVESLCSPTSPIENGFFPSLPEMAEEDSAHEDLDEAEAAVFVGPSTSARRPLRRAAKRK